MSTYQLIASYSSSSNHYQSLKHVPFVFRESRQRQVTIATPHKTEPAESRTLEAHRHFSACVLQTFCRSLEYVAYVAHAFGCGLFPGSQGSDVSLYIRTLSLGLKRETGSFLAATVFDKARHPADTFWSDEPSCCASKGSEMQCESVAGRRDVVRRAICDDWMRARVLNGSERYCATCDDWMRARVLEGSERYCAT